jgi:tetratricopeptide (TPR) repeat protein
MTNRVVLASPKEQQRFRFNLFYMGLLALMSTVLFLFGSSAFLALSCGQWFYFGCSVALLTYSLWAMGASFVSIPIVMHLNSKYSEKKYGEIDLAHSRALKLVMQLPCRKSADVPVLMSNLALMRLCQGDYESAESLFRQAVEYMEKEKRLNSTFAAAILMNNLGFACNRRGNLAEAEICADRAIQIFELSKNKAWRIGLSLPYSLKGVIHAKFGEYDTAEQNLREAYRVYNTERMPAGSVETSFQQGKNQLLLWLAYVLLKTEKREEAELMCDQGVKSIASDTSGANTLTLEILLMLANEFMNLRDFARAEQLLEIAYSIGAESPFHPDAKLTLSYFEKLLLLTDRQSEVADMRNWLRHVDHHLLLAQKSI